MFRIGIIGTENSHSTIFTKSLNIENKYSNCNVVMVYGPDLQSAMEVQKVGNVESIAENVEDFFGKVDAMMITSRSGSVHYKYAMPFIKAGMPIFIDKPFTSNIKQAKDMVRTAKETGSIITGGSGCKYAQDVLDLKEKVEYLKKDDSFISASINFAADVDSIYDGFYFYASHLIEMVTTIFGNDIIDVYATQHGKSVLATIGYKDNCISLHFTNGLNKSACTIYSKHGISHNTIDISDIFDKELEHFVKMLESEKSHISADDLIRPVYIINSILKSIQTGNKILL